MPDQPVKKLICVNIVFSPPAIYTPIIAEKILIGTIKMMANGKAILSYCAASTRKTKNRQSGKI